MRCKTLRFTRLIAALARCLLASRTNAEDDAGQGGFTSHKIRETLLVGTGTLNCTCTTPEGQHPDQHELEETVPCCVRRSRSSASEAKSKSSGSQAKGDHMQAEPSSRRGPVVQW